MKKRQETDIAVPLRIILVTPPSGVDFGIQEGKGLDYATIQIQRSMGSDIQFEFSVTVREKRSAEVPNFAGTLVQGLPTGRFIYKFLKPTQRWSSAFMLHQEQKDTRSK